MNPFSGTVRAKGVRDGEDKLVGVKDVAARAGVSVGTVSNVLNRPDVVAEATRRAVLQAIAELGFVRNESGRQLRAGQSRTIAYVVLDAANPFFTDVAKGIEEVARTPASRCSCATATATPSREARLPRAAAPAAGAWRAHHARSIRTRRRSTCSPARASRSCSSTAAAGPDWCSVGVDDVEGGALAVTHLCEQGHQRIAFVGGPMTTVQVADRLEGARQAAPPDGGRLVVLETAALNVAEGAGPASASSACRRPPPHGGVLRQRSAGLSACSSR